MINRFLLLLFFLVAIPAFAGPLPQPQIVKINARVYALIPPPSLPNPQNRGYMNNSMVVVGDKGVILVDTGTSLEIGEHLRKVIATLTPKPVTHIVNTHAHGDHYLGNGAFPKAEIISAEKCRATVTENGAEAVALMRRLTQLPLTYTRPIPATVVYPENSTQNRLINGVKIQFWVPKGSHTPGDTMVALPDDGVIAGGDILLKHAVPVMRDANIKNWIDTLAQLQKRPETTFVSGHGPLMNKADVKALHDRMATFYAKVEEGYKKGLNDSEIRKTLDLAEWKKLQNFNMMGENINRAYLEAEAANF